MTDRTTTGRPAVVLAVLFLGAFTMGCAEMLVVGLIELIAADLSVSVPDAGALLTANAIGLAVGGPALAFLTTRFVRRPVILAATAVFVLGNALPAIGADYPTFLIARVVSGAVQGLFIAAAITTATSIVPRPRAGRAMAVVISGFATASAIGLPVGTLLGQAVGWRSSFSVVVAVGLLTLVAAVLVTPSVPASAAHGALRQARAAFSPRVLALLGLCALIFVAMLSTVTYLVPFLTSVTDVPAPLVSVYLLAYGVATTVGSALGGRFADMNASRTLVVGTVGVASSLLVMFLFAGDAGIVAAAVFATGLFGMGMAPSLQHRVVSLAGAGAPLASSLPASAVNAGIAIGSLAGGLAIAGAGVRSVALTGAVIAAASIVVAAATSVLKPAAASSVPQPVSAN